MSILISFTQYIQYTKLLVACFAMFSHCSNRKVQMAHIATKRNRMRNRVYKSCQIKAKNTKTKQSNRFGGRLSAM